MSTEAERPAEPAPPQASDSENPEKEAAANEPEKPEKEAAASEPEKPEKASASGPAKPEKEAATSQPEKPEEAAASELEKPEKASASGPAKPEKASARSGSWRVDGVVKKPAGGAFGEWMHSSRDSITERAKADGGLGRGGVAKKASELWKAMSDEEKAPWHRQFNEHTAAYKAYKESDAYAPPAKKPRRNKAKAPKKELSAEVLEQAKELKMDAKLKALVAEPEIRELDVEGPTIFAALRAAKGSLSGARKALLKSGEERGEGKDSSSEASGEDSDYKEQPKRKPRPRTPPAPAVAEADLKLDPEVLLEAEKLGMKDAFIKLSPRPDIVAKGIEPRAILKALEDHRGLVHPAKRALLAA